MIIFHSLRAWGIRPKDLQAKQKEKIIDWKLQVKVSRGANLLNGGTDGRYILGFLISQRTQSRVAPPVLKSEI